MVDQAVNATLGLAFLSGDPGVAVGITLAYISVRCLLKFSTYSSAIKKLHKAPSVPVSDLRSLLSPSDSEIERLAIVRGVVQTRSAFTNGRSLSLTLEHVSKDHRGVVWKQASFPTGIVNLLVNSSTIQVILTKGGRWPQSDFVIVNMDGLNSRLYVTTVYHNALPISPSPYTFLEAVFNRESPVEVLDEEAVLTEGQEVNAVGICSLRGGTPEIKPWKDLPFFLSDMDKDQMVVNLTYRSKVILFSGVVLGSVAIGLLGYAVVRDWNRWKEWRRRQQTQQQYLAAARTEAESHVVVVAEETQQQQDAAASTEAESQVVVVAEETVMVGGDGECH